MGFSNIMDSNRFSGESTLDPATDALIEARARVLGPGYRLFYDTPVHLVRGRGSHLFDVDGVRYLDAYNNVPGVGHAHPAVTEAVTRALSTLNTHTRYLHEEIVRYSRRLLATMPEHLDRVTYACTGSEANDLALRIAHRYTGRRGVVVTADAYHGNTAAVTAISPSNGDADTPTDHVRRVPAPDTYRENGTAGARFAADVRAAIADLDAAGVGVGAFIVDTVFSSDGIYTDADLVGEAVGAVHAAGGLFIADEVQPGFARTGESMWGFGRHGVQPDLVTLGKPMGNGVPISAVVARSVVSDSFSSDIPYFNTCGGTPMSIAAASAVLDVIEDEKLMTNAADVGDALRAGIAEVAGSSPMIGDVRGVGLYTGVEVVAPGTTDGDRAAARTLVNRLRDRQVLISICGRDGNVLKIRPPLVFSLSDVDWFCTEFADACAHIG
ncbi:aspartate aminotransferase family protein [Williamsia sterculiae]|uniref:4-aminobutyrate aminotransferase n=1 Tax=Williamsia sterculiae TaxID=1344003 RepID=A0A1N7EYF4_9NOCA|nr:aspartate aminotransferase family protein [Williamsia sterculiae]SIR93091.1 4-aminobutyrate aminotransferase [Williamsia sterculiae]